MRFNVAIVSKTLLAVFTAALLMLAIAGCSSSPLSVNLDAATPATKQDVADLRADHDKAFAAVKHDLDAAGISNVGLSGALGELAAKAAALADEAQSNSTKPWYIAVGGTLLSLALGYFGLKRYDALPFVTKSGLKVSEHDLVAAVVSPGNKPAA